MESNRATHCIARSNFLSRHHQDSRVSEEDISICQDKHFSTGHWSTPYDTNFIRKCKKPVIYDDRCHRIASAPRRVTSGWWITHWEWQRQRNCLLHWRHGLHYVVRSTSRRDSQSLQKGYHLGGTFTRGHCVCFAIVGENLLEPLALDTLAIYTYSVRGMRQIAANNIELHVSRNRQRLQHTQYQFSWHMTRRGTHALCPPTVASMNRSLLFHL